MHAIATFIFNKLLIFEEDFFNGNPLQIASPFAKASL